MRSLNLRLSAAAALGAALWVVPSAGTQGQGTLGDRFIHADRKLVGAGTAARAVLATGDAAAGDAVHAL